MREEGRSISYSIGLDIKLLCYGGIDLAFECLRDLPNCYKNVRACNYYDSSTIYIEFLFKLSDSRSFFFGIIGWFSITMIF